MVEQDYAETNDYESEHSLTSQSSQVNLFSLLFFPFILKFTQDIETIVKNTLQNYKSISIDKLVSLTKIDEEKVSNIFYCLFIIFCDSIAHKNVEFQ